MEVVRRLGNSPGAEPIQEDNWLVIEDSK